MPRPNGVLFCDVQVRIFVTISSMPSARLTYASARVLEFDSLLELLRGYTQSPVGQSRVLQLSPTTERSWIENQHELTNEIREFRRVGGRFDFSGLQDVSRLVEKSRISGAALEIAEIRDVILLVDRAPSGGKSL